MSMIVTLPVLVGMAVARGVGMGMHRYLVYSTKLRPRTHPQPATRYWKL